MRSFCKKHLSLFPIIILTAFLFILPQLLSRQMIVGSDALFHFNRVYDAGMQIKEQNFQYFISLYGFQQSARIVLPFYGPMMSYLHGVLFLLSPTWFHYQLLSNFILYLLAGSSMAYLLKKVRVPIKWQSVLSLLFMMTFSVQYWILRQGFSAWGGALLPVCLLPIVDMIEKKKINRFSLGLLTALMFQTHVFSSVLLVLTYLIFFMYTFFHSPAKFRLLKELFFSILLFFLLTLNVWSSFGELYRGQKILPPFINYSMYLSTITWQSVYMLVMPCSLLILLFVQFYSSWQKKQHLPEISKILLFAESFFLLLSSNLIPWKFLIDKEVGIAKIVQFPFRFFIPATVLLIVNFGILLKEGLVQELKAAKATKWLLPISLLQTLILIIVILSFWQTEEDYLQSGIHVFVHEADNSLVKSSFFDKNKQRALQLVEKATPDYLRFTTMRSKTITNCIKKVLLIETSKLSKK